MTEKQSNVNGIRMHKTRTVLKILVDMSSTIATACTATTRRFSGYRPRSPRSDRVGIYK